MRRPIVWSWFFLGASSQWPNLPFLCLKFNPTQWRSYFRSLDSQSSEVPAGMPHSVSSARTVLFTKKPSGAPVAFGNCGKMVCNSPKDQSGTVRSIWMSQYCTIFGAMNMGFPGLFCGWVPKFPGFKLRPVPRANIGVGIAAFLEVVTIHQSLPRYSPVEHPISA